jgi:hypothetical protein
MDIDVIVHDYLFLYMLPISLKFLKRI